MCYSLWHNAPTSCNTQSSAPEDGQSNCPKHVELNGIINKLLVVHIIYISLYFLRLASRDNPGIADLIDWRSLTPDYID